MSGRIKKTEAAAETVESNGYGAEAALPRAEPVIASPDSDAVIITIGKKLPPHVLANVSTQLRHISSITGVKFKIRVAAE